MPIIRKALAWAFNVFLLSFSLYLIWGWMTISDIKSDARRRGTDSEEAVDNVTTTEGGSIQIDGTNTHIVQPKPISPYHRFNLGYSSLSVSTNGIQMMDVTPLSPFTMFSEGVVSSLFSFGVGFFLSFSIVLVRMMRGLKMTDRYFVMRGFVGGMVSAGLFFIVYSGGTLMWQNVSNVNSLSVGVIAMIGAVWCEKFPKMLESSLTSEPRDKE